MIVRKFYQAKIEQGFKHVPIVVLIGARQVGKTSLMKNFATGKATVQLNGQDPEIAELFQKRSTIEQYLSIHLNKKLDGFLLIDEFQFINGISTMLKLLTDKYNSLKVLCSGSSSLDILQKVEESLAGRVRTIEVFSLSFSEYLLFKHKELAKLYQSFSVNTESSALTAPIESALSEYLVYGGMPRASLVNNKDEKIEILHDIYQTYLLKDVRNYIKNEHVIGFNKMLRILAAQIGSLVNINELSRESGLPYKSSEACLHLLEQMYIIKLVEPYHTNKRKVINKMKKVYFCDLGLRNMIANNFNDINSRTDNGAIFENYVMLELWRNKGTGGIIQFFRTFDGTEVDFVLTQLSDKKAVECKFKMLDKPVNLIGFNNFCSDEGITKKYIINKNLNCSHQGTKFIQGFLCTTLKTQLLAAMARECGADIENFEKTGAFQIVA